MHVKIESAIISSFPIMDLNAVAENKIVDTDRQTDRWMDGRTERQISSSHRLVLIRKNTLRTSPDFITRFDQTLLQNVPSYTRP